MNSYAAISDPIWQQLAGTLLHFLWQGSLIAAGYGLLCRLRNPRTAAGHYALALTTLAVMAVCPVVTFFVLQSTPRDRSAVTQSSPLLYDQQTSSGSVVSATPAITIGENAIASASAESGDQFSPGTLLGFTSNTESARRAHAQSVDEHAPASQSGAGFSLVLERISCPIVLTWMAGVGLLSLRLCGGLVVVSRLRRAARPLPTRFATVIERLTMRLGLRRTPAICVSDRIAEPLALGWWRPLVLLPAGWLTEVPPSVLEAALAHELAHIRRWDLWANLFQRVVESLLFYHPAIWWVTRRIRMERELCCDELAVQATGQRVEYAEALEYVARRAFDERQMVLAAMMGGQRMALLNRVRHVLGLGEAGGQTHWWPAGAVALTVPVVMWLSIAGLDSAEAGDEEAGSSSGQVAFVFDEGDRDGDDKPEGRRDGDRPREEGERRDGDRPRPEGRRDGDRPRPEGRRDGDRPRPEGERRDGDRPRPEGRRDGDRPRPEGERPPHPPLGEHQRVIEQLRREIEMLRRQLREGGPRGDGDRPRPEGGPRDGDRPGREFGPRDGDRPRPEGGPRDGDRPRREFGPRDGDRPRPEGERRDGDRPRPEGRPAFGPRDGERPRPEEGRPPFGPPRGDRPDFGGPREGGPAAEFAEQLRQIRREIEELRREVRGDRGGEREGRPAAEREERGEREREERKERDGDRERDE